MYGISGIKLDKVEVTRSENLTDMRVNVVFGFDRDLEINGTYALKGTVGWFDIDTNGTQPFSVKLVNATLGPELVIDLIPAEDYNARRLLNYFFSDKMQKMGNFWFIFQVHAYGK